MQSPWVVDNPFEILTARDPSAQNDRRLSLEVGDYYPDSGAPNRLTTSKIADANGIGYKSWDGSTRYAYITDGLHWDVFSLPKTQIMHERLATVPKLDVIRADDNARILISFVESQETGDYVFGQELFVDVNVSNEGSQRYQPLPDSDTFHFWAPGSQGSPSKRRYCKLTNRREPLILRVRHYEDDAGKYADTTTLMASSWEPGKTGVYTLDSDTLMWFVGPKKDGNQQKENTAKKPYHYIPIVTFDGERLLMRVLPSLSLELRTWAPEGSTSFIKRLVDQVLIMGPMGNVLEIRVVTIRTSLASINLYNLTEDLFDANNG
jgi:hypothetical protein